MDYDSLLDLVTDLGYELAMSGAETFRIEESIGRILAAYGVEAEVFAIPNCLIVNMETADGKSMTRMRRIGYHGNDLDAVERFNALSRRICYRAPAPSEGRVWLEQARCAARSYSFSVNLLGSFLGAAGFGVFFGGSLIDGLCAGLCGIVVGLVNLCMDRLKANQFFRTIAASFLMALLAYAMSAAHIAPRPDTVIIGALMILVPGLLFTNGMRDIIFGDTNSGINRIVQVLLIAAAIALGTAAAWSLTAAVIAAPVSIAPMEYGFLTLGLACLIGCAGFSILFNIHGPGGILCTLGGLLTWAVYALTMRLGLSELMGYFAGALFASAYSEVMARIRKCPAISYLVVSIFPLIPGAGVYYTMNYAVRGEMDLFASKGMYTAAIAGLMAVGILLISTIVRLWTTWKALQKQ